MNLHNFSKQQLMNKCEELQSRINKLEKKEQFASQLLANQQDIPPDIAKVIDENFWELVTSKKTELEVFIPRKIPWPK